MENNELILMELDEFNRSNEEDRVIPQNLENLIEHVAKTGKYIFPWHRIRKLYLQKFKNVLNNIVSFTNNNNNTSSSLNTSTTTYLDTSINDISTNNGQSNKEIKERIIERMESFTSAPFTIQRISELLLKPNNHYTRIDKFLRGLEKCVMVVTTVDPNGNKIFVDNIFANGLVSSSSSSSETTDEEEAQLPKDALETTTKRTESLSVLDETPVNMDIGESESDPIPQTPTLTPVADTVNVTVEEIVKVESDSQQTSLSVTIEEVKVNSESDSGVDIGGSAVGDISSETLNVTIEQQTKIEIDVKEDNPAEAFS